MKKFILAILLAVALLLPASAAGAFANFNGEDIPAGCESGGWVFGDAYRGGKYYNPLYLTTSAGNNYGAGWKYTPCAPVGSFTNGYGAGYGVHPQ
jgi:hypothetical protein